MTIMPKKFGVAIHQVLSDYGLPGVNVSPLPTNARRHTWWRKGSWQGVLHQNNVYGNSSEGFWNGHFWCEYETGHDAVRR
jgi:hypothetical protein